MFVSFPFSPFVCQTKPDMETTKIQKTRKWAWPMERSMYKSQLVMATGGSAEQTLSGPNLKALNQPKPSDKTV